MIAVYLQPILDVRQMRFNANTTCQDGLKLTEAYHNPFVLVNEDNIGRR